MVLFYLGLICFLCGLNGLKMTVTLSRTEIMYQSAHILSVNVAATRSLFQVGNSPSLLVGFLNYKPYLLSSNDNSRSNLKT